MIAAFVILFRETLEAALVVGIVRAYLHRSRTRSLDRWVWLGVLAGASASVVVAGLFVRVAGGFSGKPEQLFEAATMLISAALLTTMIVWMAGHAAHQRKIEHSLEMSISSGRKAGIFLLVLFSVLREGVESVLFLASLRLRSGTTSAAGALLGIGGALLLGALVFTGGRKTALSAWFAVTNILLIAFAAGLVAAAVHELQEAAVLPVVVEQVWNLNPPPRPDGSFPLLHDKGAIGSILSGLFGYNANPALLELSAYGLSLAATLAALGVMKRRAVHRDPPARPRPGIAAPQA